MEVAIQLAKSLGEFRTRIVFAESCTGGLVSAELTGIPGISEWFCGSSVTYRCATKTAWLGVSEKVIETKTAVSDIVASQMASGVLRRTPEAGLACSITGHLGPSAPEGFDGLVYIGTARRQQDGECVKVIEHRLQTRGRSDRQREAAELVMRTALRALSDFS